MRIPVFALFAAAALSAALALANGPSQAQPPAGPVPAVPAARRRRAGRAAAWA